MRSATGDLTPRSSTTTNISRFPHFVFGNGFMKSMVMCVFIFRWEVLMAARVGMVCDYLPLFVYRNHRWPRTHQWFRSYPSSNIYKWFFFVFLLRCMYLGNTVGIMKNVVFKTFLLEYKVWHFCTVIHFICRTELWGFHTDCRDLYPDGFCALIPHALREGFLVSISSSTGRLVYF